MIKYIMNGDNAGKVLKWEIMISGNVSFITMSAFAKSMPQAITEDIANFAGNRTKTPGVERFDDEYKKCDISKIIIKPEGEYLSISYSLSINRISSKDIDNLKGIGFIEIMK